MRRRERGVCPGPPRASLEVCGVRWCWLCPCLRLAEGRHLGLSQGPQASPSLLWGLVSSPAQRVGPVLSGGHTGPPWGTESDLFLETEAQEDVDNRPPAVLFPRGAARPSPGFQICPACCNNCLALSLPGAAWPQSLSQASQGQHRWGNSICRGVTPERCVCPTPHSLDGHVGPRRARVTLPRVAALGCASLAPWVWSAVDPSVLPTLFPFDIEVCMA